MCDELAGHELDPGVEWYQNDLRAACMLPESQFHFREMHLQCGQWFGNAADRRESDAGISGSDVGSRL